MQGDVTYREEDDPRTRKQYSHIRTFRPRWYHMYRVFEHQAGSMAILADEAVTVLYTTIRFDDIIYNVRPEIHEQSLNVMRTVIVQRILNMALSESDEFLRELAQIESFIM